MTDLKLLNDPEYRWYHKDEMNKILPYQSERRRLGVISINYEELRAKNDQKIKPNKERSFSWERLKRLVDAVPKNCSKEKTKESLQPKDRFHFEKRDQGECYVCLQVNHYGSNNKYSLYTYNSSSVSQLHHIIPNGDVTDDNVVTLCVHCHQMVHQALYLEGKWRYSRPL